MSVVSVGDYFQTLLRANMTDPKKSRADASKDFIYVDKPLVTGRKFPRVNITCATSEDREIGMQVGQDFDADHFVTVNLIVKTTPKSFTINTAYGLGAVSKTQREILDLMLDDLRSTIKNNTTGFVTNGFNKPVPISNGIDWMQKDFITATVVYSVRERI